MQLWFVQSENLPGTANPRKGRQSVVKNQIQACTAIVGETRNHSQVEHHKESLMPLLHLVRGTSQQDLHQQQDSPQRGNTNGTRFGELPQKRIIGKQWETGQGNPPAGKGRIPAA